MAAKLDMDPMHCRMLPAIPASMLGTFVNPVGLSLAITQDRTDQVVLFLRPARSCCPRISVAYWWVYRG